MKRTLSVLPLTVLVLSVAIGAAPSTKKTTDPSSPSTTEPMATAVAPLTTIDLSESALDLTIPEEHPTNPSPEAAASAATYEIDWYSINGGGTVNATSTNYRMGASIGQSVAGAASSASYQMGIGFWYGAGSSGNCACDCHADPAPIGACDGNQDVLDVVQTVNVAFRGAAGILDPNGNCPFETTDVNCSFSTDVLDVVRMVNVAFRGANAATEFCNPCP